MSREVGFGWCKPIASCSPSWMLGGGRQNSTLQLIASENFASPAVLAATGSVLASRYAEGCPGKRSPFVTSGLRIGSPAVATAGIGEPEMAGIAQLVGRVLAAPLHDARRGAVRGEVATLCSELVPYP